MSLPDLLTRWRTDPETAPNLPTWRTLQPRPADLRPYPGDLPPALAEALGWHVLRVWECRVIADPGAVASELLAIHKG